MQINNPMSEDLVKLIEIVEPMCRVVSPCVV